MKFLSYRIIKEDEYKELLKLALIAKRLQETAYWFSGFTNVYKLLKDYARGDIDHVNIFSRRREFAIKQGLDDYGNPI